MAGREVGVAPWTVRRPPGRLYAPRMMVVKRGPGDLRGSAARDMIAWLSGES